MAGSHQCGALDINFSRPCRHYTVSVGARSRGVGDIGVVESPVPCSSADTILSALSRRVGNRLCSGRGDDETIAQFIFELVAGLKEDETEAQGILPKRLSEPWIPRSRAVKWRLMWPRALPLEEARFHQLRLIRNALQIGVFPPESADCHGWTTPASRIPVPMSGTHGHRQGTVPAYQLVSLEH